MANNIVGQVSLKLSGEGASPQLTRSVSVVQSGTGYFADVATVGTAAATLSANGCANLRFLAVHNPSDSGKTITLTMTAIVLKPGDPAYFPPANVTITAQATAASALLNRLGMEA